jgi:hypothetical protein
MNNVVRALLMLFLLLFFLKSVTAQKKIDSVIMEYLNRKPNIPKPFYKIKKEGKTDVTYTNFYVHPNTPIIIDSFKIITYRFGASQSHSPVYFLIRIIHSKYCDYKIIDNETVEEGISNLLQYIQSYKLSNSQKAQLLNQLTFSYY